MLAFAPKYPDNAHMSKRAKKRITLTDNSRNQPHEARVSQGTFVKRGKAYICYRVQGWKEDGKWQKKQFSKESDAIEFARQKNIELLNHGSKIVLVASELDKEQTREAEQAYRDLGSYSLSDAVKFYLAHHRPTDYQIRLSDGLRRYLDNVERSGEVKEPTRKRMRARLNKFNSFCHDPIVHEVTSQQIKRFLSSLRTKEGKPAKKATWNHYRGEISSFFKWAREEDLDTNRPWTFNDPMKGITQHKAKKVKAERPAIATTSPVDVRELMSYAMRYKGGKMVKYFALAYFAGIRPSTDEGELVKLALQEDEIINLATGYIRIPESVAKTEQKRQVRMSDNLLQWLRAYEGKPIAPVNLKNDYRHIRKKFNLQSDEPRHSFISYHVALHRSIGDTALQAGNSERMIENHYLNLHTVEEGADFFSIVPDMETGEAVYSEKAIETPQNLKAI